MNERINQLILDAGFVHYGEDTGSYNIPVPAFKHRMEMFAELIVSECISNMQNCDGDLDFAIWKTKKDFGVEE